MEFCCCCIDFVVVYCLLFVCDVVVVLKSLLFAVLCPFFKVEDPYDQT